MVKKLKVHFGIRVDFIANRFFLAMADHMTTKRIYFKEFIDKMYESVFSEEVGE